MEHAKKMMIVPPELLQRLTVSENTQPKILSQLDEDMQKVLGSKLSDHDKWAQYNQVLQRYLHFTDQSRQPVNVPVEVKQESLQHSDILATLPDTYKRKAKNLINILSSTGSIDWDDKGTVSIKGEILPSSNIIDLINDTLRPRKSSNPAGWEQFASFMNEKNIPHELIGNPKRRNVSSYNQSPKFLKSEVKPEDYDADSEGRIKEVSGTASTSQQTPASTRSKKRKTLGNTTRSAKSLGWARLKL